MPAVYQLFPEQNNRPSMTSMRVRAGVPPWFVNLSSGDTERHAVHPAFTTDLMEDCHDLRHEAAVLRPQSYSRHV